MNAIRLAFDFENGKCLMKNLLVVFSHGKESGPLGSKIQALMRVAEQQGARTLSVNYREHPDGNAIDHDMPGEADRTRLILRGSRTTMNRCG